jgi:hypothetical protein
MKLETITRPKKAEAYDLIVELHKGGKLTAYETSMLVNYFSPPLPKKSKTAWQYVAKAVSETYTQGMMRYVHVEAGVAYATDGHRIHWAPVDLADGSYSAKTGAVVEDVDTGEAIRRIKNLIDEPRTPVGQGKAETAKLETYKAPVAGSETVVKLEYGMHVQLPYLLDAINHEKVFEYTVLAMKVYVECELGKALVAEYRI